MKRCLIVLIPFICISLRAYAQEPDLVQILQDSLIPKKYLIGDFDPATDKLFTTVPVRYASRPGLYLHKETLQAFTAMHQAALKDTVQLVIVSATRNFEYQKLLWEQKWSGSRLVKGKNLANVIANDTARADTILQYTAMPGTSRHHWGTDIDIKSVDNNYFLTEQGRKVYDWLLLHGHEYGFCQTYTQKRPERPTGFEEEKWHWSYMPLAQHYLLAYELTVEYADLKHFKGIHTAEFLGVIERYVLGVDPACR